MSGATFRPTDRVDFIVIGGGAAGGVMAKELSTSGFRVVLLEQGPWLREKRERRMQPHLGEEFRLLDGLEQRDLLITREAGDAGGPWKQLSARSLRIREAAGVKFTFVGIVTCQRCIDEPDNSRQPGAWSIVIGDDLARDRVDLRGSGLIEVSELPRLCSQDLSPACSGKHPLAPGDVHVGY